MTAVRVLERDMFSGPLHQYSDSLKLCNRESHIYSLSDLFSNRGMKTNDEIRRDNLAIAVKRAGSATILAELANVSSVYLSQIKNRAPEAKTGKPKAMGDDVARKIEAAINEQLGWMDADHSPGLMPAPSPPDERIVEPLEVSKLFQLYFESTIKGRQRILDAAEIAAKRVTTGNIKAGNHKA